MLIRVPSNQKMTFDHMRLIENYRPEVSRFNKFVESSRGLYDNFEVTHSESCCKLERWIDTCIRFTDIKYGRKTNAELLLESRGWDET
jgi:hypothetical protein